MHHLLQSDHKSTCTVLYQTYFEHVLYGYVFLLKTFLMYIQCTLQTYTLFFSLKLQTFFFIVYLYITPSNDFFPLEARLQIWSSLQGTCQVVFVYLCNVLQREAVGLFDTPRAQNCHPWQSMRCDLSECVWMHFNRTQNINSLILSQELHFTDASALWNAIWYKCFIGILVKFYHCHCIFTATVYRLFLTRLRQDNAHFIVRCDAIAPLKV